MRKNVKKNLRDLGFEKEVENVEQKKCPFCGKIISGREDFDDNLSWKEYKISGLCQSCQNEMFG